MMKERFGAGIDIGSCTTKVVIVDAYGSIVGSAIGRSGYDFRTAALKYWKASIEKAGIAKEHVIRIISTGYGRNAISFSHKSMTEISCHASGAYFYFPEAITLVDIGGQDNKIIHLNDSGTKTGFKLNRKCAAGTGVFIEEMANRLGLGINDLEGLARSSTKDIELGSYCTVFTATEVLSRISQGEKIEDIVKGIFRSVLKRILEMDILTEKVVMAGGVVAHNPFLMEMLSEYLGVPVWTTPQPQFNGAFGAALLSLSL